MVERLFAVSIHALTRRATFRICSKRVNSRFQSTPSRGGRPDARRLGKRGNSFNPRPHAEGDKRTKRGWVATIRFQSTPSRGGRQIRNRPCLPDASFNPRPHAEGDTIRATITATRIGFNPRPHAEGDRNTRTADGESVSFNPRPHAEGDGSKSLIASSRFRVSIHALTRRATLGSPEKTCV